MHHEGGNPTPHKPGRWYHKVNDEITVRTNAYNLDIVYIQTVDRENTDVLLEAMLENPEQLDELIVALQFLRMKQREAEDGI